MSNKKYVKTNKQATFEFLFEYCGWIMRENINRIGKISAYVTHPSLDNPQKKNKKTHLGDPNIDQVDGVGYPKTFETKSS